MPRRLGWRWSSSRCPGPCTRSCPRDVPRALRHPSEHGLNKSPNVQVHNPRSSTRSPFHPVDEPGVDPGPSRSSSPLEPVQRAGHAARLQLGVGSLESSRPGRIPVPRSPRLHRAGCRHPRDRGYGSLRTGKVLRLGTLGCVTAAITFELCGPLWGISDGRWPRCGPGEAGPLRRYSSCCGDEEAARQSRLLAVVDRVRHLCGQSRRRSPVRHCRRSIFTLAMLLLRAPALGGSGPVIRPVVDLAISAIAGAALAAPLILPGLQLGQGSNRSAVGPDLFPKGLPPKDFFHLIFQGFDGLPVLHSQWFGLSAYAATLPTSG